jgi:methyl-accepting chemotaxis protein
MINKIGICNSEGQILCTIKVGNDSIDISRNGRYFYTLINKRAILASCSEKDAITRTGPVISILLRSLCKQGNIKQVSVNKSYLSALKNYREMIDSMIKQISDNLGGAEISVLETVPDEIQENTPAEARSASLSGLSAMKNELPIISETVENIKHMSDILLKTNLSKNVWGGKEVSSVLHETKSNLEKMSDSFELLDRTTEQLDDTLRQLTASSKNKSQARDLIGKLIDNFSTIKTVISELAQSTNKLYDIDFTFKKATGYPATWFLNSSIYHDFMFEYDNLMEQMVKLARIEENTVSPLLVWKVKTGEQ